jgi:hypothetical protein
VTRFVLLDSERLGMASKHLIPLPGVDAREWETIV